MKDYIRDYATAAFRFYAQNDKSAEAFKKKIYEEALESIKEQEGCTGVSKPTEGAIMRAEKAVNEKIAEIKDMEAVEKVLAEYRSTWKSHIARAIELVYFKDPDKEIGIGDIQNRVNAAVIEISASERSIYYWLKQARELFAQNRGLRV